MEPSIGAVSVQYLLVDFHDLKIMINFIQNPWCGKKNPQWTGFEPARGVPIGFQVQRLNHSATTAQM